jgi:hypothetical protein
LGPDFDAIDAFAQALLRGGGEIDHKNHPVPRVTQDLPRVVPGSNADAVGIADIQIRIVSIGVLEDRSAKARERIGSLTDRINP